MTSTLGYALLGLLAREPMTGYELTRRLRAPVGYFWSATHSQVYPELARLDEDGFVRSRVVPGPGPRQNRRYTLTAAGRRALAAWVVTPAPEVNRDEFLLRVHSLWLAEPQAAVAMVEQRVSRQSATLASYTRIEREVLGPYDGGPVPLDHPAFGSWATARHGVAFARQDLAWCRWLLGQLRRAAPASPAPRT